MKKLIRSMGANKTEKAIERASTASGGVSKIVEAFEENVNICPKSGSHTHKQSADDEKIISVDLRSLRPFREEEGRSFETFVGISHDPTIHWTRLNLKNGLIATRRTLCCIIQLHRKLNNPVRTVSEQLTTELF
jgi:hypothetical protein